MAQTRPATPVAGTIALVLLGGAVATAVGAIMMFARLYQTDLLEAVRHSTGYYAFACVLVGFFTAIGLMLTRPRGPVAPIVAVISAIVALYVGNRLGVITYAVTHGGVPGGDFLVDVMKYHFDVEDLLAPLVAGIIGGLRVAMVAGSLAPRRPSGQPFPQPGGHGRPYPPAPGQQMPGQQMPGQQMPGQPPVPGQPIQPPAPSGQPYPPPGPGGPHQGGPPPSGGA
ncbi:hypothetical protein [Actinomadura sp. 3N407]|uniref:hypothetical protein n=1 Tax=Actinomadura sp. 3N407 TaxID=3457423 RepID=UPI003FCE3BCF